MSRQHEMKRAHDSQQQFHSLLKEYMGKNPRLRASRKAPEEESHLHIARTLHSIVRWPSQLYSLVTAPLMTLNTALQTSVTANVRTIRDFQAEVSQADMAQRARTGSLKAERAPRFTALLGMRTKQSIVVTN